MHQDTPSPFRIFAVALFCQSVAGVEYWWPALLTSFHPQLGISATQSTILIAIANSGGTLSIPAGFFHSHYGSHKTALLGSLSLAFSFLILAFLPLASEHVRFPAALVATTAVVPAAFALYAGSLSLSSAVFPPCFRGRVVGLLTAAYAASAAIYASLQSAFFPEPEHATRLLLICASGATLAAILIAVFFPHADDFDTEPQHHLQHSYEAISRPHQLDTHVTSRIGLAYRLVWILVIFLQLGAVSEAFSAPPVFLRALVLAVAGVMFLVLTYIPHKSPLRVRPTLACDTTRSAGLFSVVKDPRFQYLALSRFLIIGGGGLTVLIQSRNVVASRLVLTRPDAIPAVVRTVVMVFSTSNVTVRLLAGAIMDASTEEESLFRKYHILHTDSLILAVTLPLLPLLPYWGFLVGIVAVGMGNGIYFSSAPALCTLWFGVREYPRNWCALGPFQLVAIATIASSIPKLLMERFGNWVMVGEERFCIGVMCTLPTFAMIGALDLMLYGIGWPLRKSLRTSS